MLKYFNTSDWLLFSVLGHARLIFFNLPGRLLTFWHANHAEVEKLSQIATIIQKFGKGKAYKPVEDLHLCNAWIVTSEDPITGTGQKKDSFWKSIIVTFQCLQGVEAEDSWSLSSLQRRWAAINKDCTKFNGIFVQLKAVPRPWWSQEKFKEETLKLYKEEVKEDFKFLSCWLNLKEKPMGKYSGVYSLLQKASSLKIFSLWLRIQAASRR